MWKQLSKVLKLAGAAFAIFASAFSANAQMVLYGANGGGANPATVLVTINPATGVATPVGPIGFAVTGMALHPTTGVLYGSTGGNAPVSPNSIITINRATGAGTLVGATGLGGPVADLTFRADGVLFGWSEGSDELVTINTATGVGTVVGPNGLSTFGSGISFHGGALLLAPNGNNGPIYTINPATGAETVGPTLAGSPGSVGAAIAALASSGPTLFGVSLDSGGLGVQGPAFLITINPVTGAVTNVGGTIAGLDAIAFAPLAGGGAQNAPTLSEWSMILLGLLLAGTAMWAIKKRRA